MECRLGRTRAAGGKVARSSYPVSLVQVMRCRSARSGQGRAFRTAKRSLDGEDRSGIVRGDEGKGIPQPSSHLPTKTPEYPQGETGLLQDGKKHSRWVYRWG